MGWVIDRNWGDGKSVYYLKKSNDDWDARQGKFGRHGSRHNSTNEPLPDRPAILLDEPGQQQGIMFAADYHYKFVTAAICEETKSFFPAYHLTWELKIKYEGWSGYTWWAAEPSLLRTPPGHFKDAIRAHNAVYPDDGLDVKKVNF